MKILKLSGIDLINLGFPEGKSIGSAIKIMNENYTHLSLSEQEILLKDILANPEKYIEDAILGTIANDLMKPIDDTLVLLEQPGNFAVYGAAHIEAGAIKQMETAMRLPVTIGGALMPDAHQGYGLPIGGVLATKNSIIPYGVGVDIGCRMALSIFDISEAHFIENQAKFKRELIAWTSFGAGAGFTKKMVAEHAILDNPVFNMNPLLKSLQDKTVSQLGTSGGGNHFVEWGFIEFEQNDTKLNMQKGKYLALLSHSGSRGLGATIAAHYTKLAKSICKLPAEAANLAYLDMNSEEGMEYWLAMNLAGDFASACHEIIHARLSKAMGAEVLAKVENHHNFAWKETWNGEDVLVHRKGATPAAKDVMGIIPGSMTAPGFLVKGKGELSSLNSASHGAGRAMSRTQATKSFNRGDLKKILADHDVTLIGAGIDEAPMAYKNIETVMAGQTELVEIIAKFTPKMVRMADDGSRED